MLDAACDLLLGGSCAGCGVPGRPWCRSCAGALTARLATARPVLAAPTPAPPGLPPVWAVGAYEGEWRAAVLAFKERGRRRLAVPLGRALAGALASAAAGEPAARCVPIPGSRAARAERGYDQVTLLLRSAVAVGAPPPAALLRWTRAGADQVGLDTAQRQANRHGALVARRCDGAVVVLVDDILTTGATLAEAARALRAAGARVVGAGTVAATVRRRPGLPRTDIATQVSEG